MPNLSHNEIGIAVLYEEKYTSVLILNGHTIQVNSLLANSVKRTTCQKID
jgi:hypothetical protein